MTLHQLNLHNAIDSVPLSALWQDRPLMLVMLRHTGCPICREHLIVTEGLLEKLQDAGYRVIGVAQSNGADADLLRRELELSFPVLGDPDNALYRALAMPRGSWWQVTLGPMLREPLKGLRRLREVRKPGRDVRQLGGVVILDTRGEVRFLYYQKDSADMPAEAELLQAAQTVLA